MNYERYLTTSALTMLYPFLGAATIAKWVETGKVRTNGNGQRSEQDAINHYVSRNNQELERLKSRSDEGSVREALEVAKLRKLELEADLLEVERDAKRGKLIEVEPAIAEIDEAFARVRTKLMALPDRLALQLSGMSDPAAIMGLLNDVVREALQELHTSLTVEPEPDGPTD